MNLLVESVSLDQNSNDSLSGSPRIDHAKSLRWGLTKINEIWWTDTFDLVIEESRI